MSDPSVRVGVSGPRRAVALLVAGLMLLAGPAAGVAAAAGPEPRVEGGRCLSPSGLLLAGERTGRAWRPVQDKGSVSSRDVLLALPGLRAGIEVRPGALTLALRGNLTDRSFLGQESAVVLHDSRAF